MSAERSILGVIPARSGSKGVPGKNLRVVAGKPLVVWTIEAALGSGALDTVLVSTDSEEIATVARAAGAEVPFLRPEHLATDASSTVDAVLHAVDAYAGCGVHFDDVMVLQPTSPLRQAGHIREAVALRDSSGAAAVVSVCETAHSPLLSNTLPADGRMGSFIREDLAGLRRQDLPVHYQLNGAIYLIDIDTLRSERRFIGSFAVAYIMPDVASVDIDREIDLAVAEVLLSAPGKD
jgi:CMP-N-acetylneuraminic acid synthetase